MGTVRKKRTSALSGAQYFLVISFLLYSQSSFFELFRGNEFFAFSCVFIFSTTKMNYLRRNAS